MKHIDEALKRFKKAVSTMTVTELCCGALGSMFLGPGFIAVVILWVLVNEEEE